MPAKIDLLKVLKENPGALKNAGQLEGILKDSFQECKGEANILLCAWKAGIHGEILRAGKVDMLLASRLIHKLTAEYGLSEHNARWAVATWCGGLEICCPVLLQTAEDGRPSSFEAEEGDGEGALLQSLPEMARCLYRFAEQFDREGRPGQAFEYFMKAAVLGNRTAQYTIGMMYGIGEGTGRDLEKSAEWLGRAAEQGHADAQYYLGLMYELGEGVGQDSIEAAVWFTEAAEQGHAEAQCSLGLLYETGRGVGRNLKKAMEWYGKAAKQGNADAAAFMRALGD